MIDRPIGNTGMRASIVGLGAEHLENKPYELAEEVIHAALDGGINIIDVFMAQPQVRRDIRRALGDRRKDVLIQGHIGSTYRDGQLLRTRDLDACKRAFDEFIDLFEYADLGLMFFVDTQEDYRDSFETEYIDYVLDLKRQGLIRAVGASSHNAVTAARMVETGHLEMLMFSVNAAYDMLPGAYLLDDVFSDKVKEVAFDGMDPQRAKLYELCASRGVGVTAMKPLAGGWLLDAQRSPFGASMSVAQCIHYVLARPAVASALVGCASKEQVAQALSYLDASDEERDYAAIARRVKGDLRGRCMYCNHCLPCPSGIDIAAVTKYLDLARFAGEGAPDSVREHYRALGATAEDCIECGSCEGNCPFGVHVIENMREAKRRFGA